MDRELFNMTDSTLALLADIILIVLATCQEGLSASYNGIVRPDLDRYRNGYPPVRKAAVLIVT